MGTTTKTKKERPSTPPKRPSIKGQPSIGNLRKERVVHEGENNFLDASQMPLKIPSELPYQGHGRRANSSKPEVPAQRSDTEELLWKLYDSRVAVSLPRRKVSKTQIDDETKENKSQEYVNRCKNTKPPNQNRTPNTSSDTPTSSSLDKSLGHSLLKNKACQSLGWCPSSPRDGARRSLGRSPAGGCPLSCGPGIPAMPLVRTPVTTWLISHRTTRVRRVYLS